MSVSESICLKAFIQATSHVYTLVNYLFFDDNGEVLFCEAFTESAMMIQQEIEVCPATLTRTALVEIVGVAEDTHIVSIYEPCHEKTDILARLHKVQKSFCSHPVTVPVTLC